MCSQVVARHPDQNDHPGIPRDFHFLSTTSGNCRCSENNLGTEK